MTPTTDDADRNDEHYAGQFKSLTLKKVLVGVVLVIIVVTLCIIFFQSIGNI